MLANIEIVPKILDYINAQFAWLSHSSAACAAFRGIFIDIVAILSIYSGSFELTTAIHTYISGQLNMLISIN